jgi:hypothetical protein
MSRGGWQYVPDARGRHYNWAKHPTFECPNADTLTYTPSEHDGEEGTWTLDRDEISIAAAAIGADPILLAKVLRQRHQTMTAGRLRVDGVLTDRCSVCGTKMTRKGFRAWIDEPSQDAASQRVSKRIGVGPPRTTIRVTWHSTRVEAAKWARHEKARADAAKGR